MIYRFSNRLVCTDPYPDLATAHLPRHTRQSYHFHPDIPISLYQNHTSPFLLATEYPQCCSFVYLNFLDLLPHLRTLHPDFNHHCIQVHHQ